MPLKFIARLSTNSAVDINFFLSKLSQGLAGFSVSRIRKLLFISLFCTKFQLDSLIFEDLRIVKRKIFLLSVQITSPASLILYSNAIIVPSPLLWSLNYRFCHCRILARERQKDHRGCRYGSHTILYTISKFVCLQFWLETKPRLPQGLQRRRPGSQCGWTACKWWSSRGGRGGRAPTLLPGKPPPAPAGEQETEDDGASQHASAQDRHEGGQGNNKRDRVRERERESFSLTALDWIELTSKGPPSSGQHTSLCVCPSVIVLDLSETS